MGCAFFVGHDLCDWCRAPRSEHDAFPCGSCGGSAMIPDPYDRDSQRAGIPIYLWRRIPCDCRRDEFGIRRFGGYLDKDGRPLEDDELEARGIIRRPKDPKEAR